MPGPKRVNVKKTQPGSNSAKDRCAPTAERRAQLLAVTPNHEDQKTLRRMLKGQRFHVSLAASCAEAMGVLRSKRISIVVCDQHLPDGIWKDILDHSIDYREHLTLIVSSRLADDSLWAEVLALGAYDILSKPFDEHEVRRVITGAWLREAGTIRTSAASH